MLATLVALEFAKDGSNVVAEITGEPLVLVLTLVVVTEPRVNRVITSKLVGIGGKFRTMSSR